ncbi:MAG: DUF1585 domain-containing protein [Proteobacteria bacterium]|nr:MAG: DUF1585 domain-containing protein [Pseudomonadota bacterium]
MPTRVLGRLLPETAPSRRLQSFRALAQNLPSPGAKPPRKIRRNTQVFLTFWPIKPNGEGAMKKKSTYLSFAARCAFPALLMLGGLSNGHASPLQQAARMHERLVGAPPSDPQTTLDMEALIRANRGREAAYLAMDAEHFYRSSLKNFFTPWSNAAENPDAPLNDFTATAIGMVRDDVPFDQALYGDIIYVGHDDLVHTMTAADDGVIETRRHIVPFNAFATLTNSHYTEFETKLIDPDNLSDITTQRSRISFKRFLQRKSQLAVLNQKAARITESAGLLTTNQAGFEFFTAGTNRRAVRFAFKNFLCHDMEQLQDTSRSDFRVRQDVDRAPAGDTRIFKQTCVGCHAGMDALAGAFAQYNFDNGTIRQRNTVNAKYTQNGSVYPAGFVTTNNSWINLWASGPNAALGFKGATSGSGARALGELLSKTDAFSQCMAKRVFQKVCLRSPSEAEAATVKSLATQFVANNHSMKSLFASVSLLPQCLGE